MNSIKQKLDEKKLLRKLLSGCAKKNDIALVKKAFAYSMKMHEGQKRASGEPFFIHPYETALTLAKWGMDNKTIAAGLLHDVVEDAKCNSAELIKLFGPKVCELVLGITQSKTKLLSKERIKTRALKETLLASMETINPVIIKLADKLHNLKTLEFLPEKRRQEIARNALNIYSPLAEKLGMNELKYQIERLSFPQSNPKEFKKIMDFLKKNNPKKLIQIKKAAKELKPLLGKMLVKTEPMKRPAFIIYNKILRKGELKSIYDYIVMVVVVEKKEDCYKAMGRIHQKFQPLPGKIKDFIAIPKNDFYSAIHTTVMGPDGKRLKIYIQSREMYENARKGVLALLEKRKEKHLLLKQKIDWLKKLRKRKAINSRQLALLLGIENIAKKTFVFDSKGKLIELPQNSTVIDYYFAHREARTPFLKSVKINNKKARFNSMLSAGDIIEAEYAKKPTINDRWFLLTKSEETYGKIKNALKKFKKTHHARFYSITIKVKNVPGGLAKITRCLGQNNINIEEIYQEEFDIESGKNMHVYLKVKADSAKSLKKAVKELKKIKDIKSVGKKEI